VQLCLVEMFVREVERIQETLKFGKEHVRPHSAVVDGETVYGEGDFAFILIRHSHWLAVSYTTRTPRGGNFDLNFNEQDIAKK